MVILALLLPWFPVTQTRRSEDQQLTTEAGKRNVTFRRVTNMVLPLFFSLLPVRVFVSVGVLEETCP